MLQLSSRRRWLAPLAMVVGAFMMLFGGLKLLVTNWRLTLVQIVPAMWIWLAMFDLKIHVLHGKQFHVIRGPLLIPAVLVVTGLTAASFYLNGVFAFAISVPGKPKIRPAFGMANRHLGIILAWGVGIGLALSYSTLIVTRWGHWPFVISQSIVVGIMMLFYLSVPARIVGIDTKTTDDAAGQARRLGRRRRGGRRRLLAALHTGSLRDLDARLALSLLAGRGPHRRRGRAPDRRDQRGQGGEVLRQARREPQSRRDLSSQARDGRRRHRPIVRAVAPPRRPPLARCGSRRRGCAPSMPRSCSNMVAVWPRWPISQ